MAATRYGPLPMQGGRRENDDYDLYPRDRAKRTNTIPLRSGSGKYVFSVLVAVVPMLAVSAALLATVLNNRVNHGAFLDTMQHTSYLESNGFRSPLQRAFYVDAEATRIVFIASWYVAGQTTVQTKI